jgi:hypothetical protein
MYFRTGVRSALYVRFGLDNVVVVPLLLQQRVVKRIGYSSCKRHRLGEDVTWCGVVLVPKTTPDDLPLAGLHPSRNEGIEGTQMGEGVVERDLDYAVHAALTKAEATTVELEAERGVLPEGGNRRETDDGVLPFEGESDGWREYGVYGVAWWVPSRSFSGRAAPGLASAFCCVGNQVSI